MRNTWPPLLKRACSFPQGLRTDPRELATGGSSSLDAAGAFSFNREQLHGAPGDPATNP